MMRQRNRLAGLALSMAIGFAAMPARAQVVMEFPVAGATSGGIATGPDGALWFIETVSKIGRITTAGVITDYPVITNFGLSATDQIVAGPDGALWFTESGAFSVGNIGRITTAGDVTEFPTPTSGSGPSGIAVGPDGNLWFTELFANNVGRITTAGVSTEFPIPTPSSYPNGIATGPDGRLWFTEGAKQIGRITTAGVITDEFPASIPAFGGSYAPYAITSGPDGKLWFTGGCCGVGSIDTSGNVTTYPGPGASGSNVPDIVTGPDGNLWLTFSGGNQVGSITTGGASVAFTVPTGSSMPNGIALGPDGKIWFTEQFAGVGRVDFAASAVLPTSGPAAGTAVALTGIGFQTGASFAAGGASAGEIVVISANQMTGTTPSLAPGSLNDVVVTNADASSQTLANAFMAEFGDVPGSNLFAPFVEKLFRNGITGGCGGGDYCPANPVTRQQMAVFLLKAEHGSTYSPPTCTGVFPDVPCPGSFADWIERLAAEGITGGCGGGDFCPTNAVSRQQMAVFLLKTEHGPSYVPPACAGIFPDVVCPSLFADWIEELFHAGITSGCGGGDFCPANPVNRGQMAAFLTKTFGLQ